MLQDVTEAPEVNSPPCGDNHRLLYAQNITYHLFYISLFLLVVLCTFVGSLIDSIYGRPHLRLKTDTIASLESNQCVAISYS